MHTRSKAVLQKILSAVIIVAMLFIAFLASSMPAVHAQDGNPYFTSITVQKGDVSLEKDIISGPPTPPAGFEADRAVVDLEALPAGTSKTLTVPAYNWVFGCSSVSGSMIAAYYDRNGYSNMYTGPTNGQVMPLDNSCWGTWSDGVDTYPNIPLAATHNGVDGRGIRGSIDDYWVQYGSTASDPYVTGSWTQHTWGEAIGDYMKTSQSAYGNTDGSTTFYNYTSSAAQLTCADMVSYGIDTVDGTYGRKLFYEARGYTVTDCYSQKTDNTVAGGFSFAQYKAEIDAGRPVMLNLAGHTIVGVGYDDATNTVYIHDTWDYLTHSMTWGTSYSGMQLLSVSIVNLAPDYAAAPTGLTATLQNGPKVRLDWTDNASNEDGFKIYRSVDGGALQFLASVGANATTYNSSVLPGKAYNYTVRAYNYFGVSNYAGPAGVSVPAVPAAPSGLAVTAITGPKAHLTWTDNASNEDGFQIYRNINGGAYALLATVGANVTTYDNSPVTGGWTYGYKVRAYNIGGSSAFAGPQTVLIPSIPAAPSGLSAIINAGPVVHLTWTDNANNETGFQIYRRINGGTFQLLATVGANVTFYDNAPVAHGFTYEYEVRAYNAAGYSAFTSPFMVVIP